MIPFESLGHADSKCVETYIFISLYGTYEQNAEIGQKSQKIAFFLKIPKSVKNIRFVFIKIVFYA